MRKSQPMQKWGSSYAIVTLGVGVGVRVRVRVMLRRRDRVRVRVMLRRRDRVSVMRWLPCHSTKNCGSSRCRFRRPARVLWLGLALELGLGVRLGLGSWPGLKIECGVDEGVVRVRGYDLKVRDWS